MDGLGSSHCVPGIVPLKENRHDIGFQRFNCPRIIIMIKCLYSARCRPVYIVSRIPEANRSKLTWMISFNRLKDSFIFHSPSTSTSFTVTTTEGNNRYYILYCHNVRELRLFPDRNLRPRRHVRHLAQRHHRPPSSGRTGAQGIGGPVFQLYCRRSR